MAATSNILFEEKQFLGHNRLGILVRTVLALFCFIGYYWSENPKPVQVSFVHIGSYPIQHISDSGLAFFVVGVSLLLLSTLLIFIPHFSILISSGEIHIRGFLTSRKILIRINEIVAIRRSRYKRNILRSATYNLHNKGIIRFYNSGEEFIELLDKKGFTYRIGSQRSRELFNIIAKHPAINSGNLLT